MQPARTGKKIVSKGAYAAVQSKRASQGLLGTCLYVAAVICGIGALLFFMVLLYVTVNLVQITSVSNFIGFSTCLGILLIFIMGTKFLRMLALNIIKKAHEIDPGVPLTRSNTAHLPAPNSLVRASSEPEPAQQNVLLRTAQEGLQDRTEELVRAFVGEEK